MAETFKMYKVGKLWTSRRVNFGFKIYDTSESQSNKKFLNYEIWKINDKGISDK